MATRIYAVNPGDNTPAGVIEDVGPTATSAAISLVIDIATTVVNSTGGTTRVVSKQEILNALEQIMGHIMRKDTWPPA